MKSAHSQAKKELDKVCKMQGGAIPEGSYGDAMAKDDIDKTSSASGHNSAPSPGVSGSIPVNEGNVGTGGGY